MEIKVVKLNDIAQRELREKKLTKKISLTYMCLIIRRHN